MTTVKIKINDSGMLKKLSKLSSSVRQVADEMTEQMLTDGMNYARSIAPRHTGRMASFIKRQKFKTRDGIRAELHAQNPTGSKCPPKYRTVTRSQYPNGKFNLTLWAHTSPRAVGYFKGGKKHNFMDVTRDWLQRRKKQYGDLTKQKILKRTN